MEILDNDQPKKEKKNLSMRATNSHHPSGSVSDLQRQGNERLSSGVATDHTPTTARSPRSFYWRDAPYAPMSLCPYAPARPRIAHSSRRVGVGHNTRSSNALRAHPSPCVHSLTQPEPFGLLDSDLEPVGQLLLGAVRRKQQVVEARVSRRQAVGIIPVPADDQALQTFQKSKGARELHRKGS